MVSKILISLLFALAPLRVLAHASQTNNIESGVIHFLFAHGGILSLLSILCVIGLIALPKRYKK